jgi:hypothetical protein
MRRLSRSEARRISELENQMGSQTFRNVMSTSESGRIIDPRRLARWESGRGRLSEAEAERLKSVSANAARISTLKERNEDKTSWKVNKSLRNWVAGGKQKGIAPDDEAEKERQRIAAKALGYLGVDTQSGQWYVTKRG